MNGPLTLDPSAHRMGRGKLPAVRWIHAPWSFDSPDEPLTPSDGEREKDQGVEQDYDYDYDGYPLDPPWDPLHPLHIGKTESELMFQPLHYPLQAATDPLHLEKLIGKS